MVKFIVRKCQNKAWPLLHILNSLQIQQYALVYPKKCKRLQRGLQTRDGYRVRVVFNIFQSSEH